MDNLGNNKPKEILSLLCNLNILNRDSDGRYTVLGPHLIRTLDDELVLCGARSHNTVEWINNKIPGGATAKKLDCGIDRITISEEAATELEDVIGPTPTGHLSLEILESIASQSSWEKSLRWSKNFSVDYYAPPPQYEVKVFDFASMSFKKNIQTYRRQGYSYTAEKLPMALFQDSNDYVNRGYLKTPSTKEKSGQQAILHSLDDLRRGRYLLCQINQIMPILYQNSKFCYPRYMLIPTELDRALHLMHFDSPSIESINWKFGEASCFKLKSKQIANLVLSKIWMDDNTPQELE
ncbi:MAG: hypothetical protein VW551_06390 [Euryarchaeota archaeon]